MTGRSVIILCAACVALSSRADTNSPPSAIYSGGAYDGHAFTPRNTYTAPATSIARFSGGFYDGHDFSQVITYSAPANASVRFPGGSFDGYAYATRDTYTAPANANVRFAGSSYDGYAFAERDTFNPATLLARFSGGFYDGSAIASSGPYPNPLNRDTDGNGIHDWWIAYYYRTVFGPPANADLDVDGMTTWQEYIADTDPTDPDSYFGIKVIRVTNTASIVFTGSSSNRLYTFEYTTNLPSSVWQPVSGVPQRLGVGGLDTFTDPAVPTARAYRVRATLP